MFMANVEYLRRLDLQFIADAMVRDGYERAAAERVVDQYRAWLEVAAEHPELPLTPSVDIDAAWHRHVLHTARYARDCDAIFGHFVHHTPTPHDSADVSEGWKNTLALMPTLEPSVWSGCVLEPAACIRAAVDTAQAEDGEIGQCSPYVH